MRHTSLLLCVFLSHTYLKERQLEDSAVSWWLELWLLRVRTCTLNTHESTNDRACQTELGFSILLLDFLPW